MKKQVKKIIVVVLRFLSYVSGALGGLCFIGAVGSLENDAITIRQFLTLELQAVILIALTFVLYVIRKHFTYYYIIKKRNYRCN